MHHVINHVAGPTSVFKYSRPHVTYDVDMTFDPEDVVRHFV